MKRTDTDERRFRKCSFPLSRTWSDSGDVTDRDFAGRETRLFCCTRQTATRWRARSRPRSESSSPPPSRPKTRAKSVRWPSFSSSGEESRHLFRVTLMGEVRALYARRLIDPFAMACRRGQEVPRPPQDRESHLSPCPALLNPLLTRFMAAQKKKGLEYFVSWVGYSASHNSWEPAENVST